MQNTQYFRSWIINKMDKLVSVIVPVYNVQEFVGECIESIINQTYTNMEIILVDDGSTDQSGVICDEYAKKDKRISVIHKENGGLSDARNAGVIQAKGEYISFVDSDDYLAPETISKFYKELNLHDCDIAVCNIMRFYDDGTTDEFYVPTYETTILKGNDKFETLKQPSVCNKLFKAKLFTDIKFPKGKFYEDTFVYHVLAYRAKKIVLTGYAGYWYRLRKSSILGEQKINEKYFDAVEAIWERTCFLIEKDVHPYAEEACLSLYVATANVEKYLTKNCSNTVKLHKVREQYKTAYDYLMTNKNTGIKQKIRLVLLKVIPKLHNRIYG